MRVSSPILGVGGKEAMVVYVAGRIKVVHRHSGLGPTGAAE